MARERGSGHRAGQNRLRCVCFSFELSFFFHFGMLFSDQCCVPRCSNRGMASPLLLFHSFQRSSELRERFFICHSSGWLIELPRPQQRGRIHGKRILPEKKCSLSCSCLRACELFHRPVLWNLERLDTSRKQVQCHRCFFSPACLPSSKWDESTKHVDALRESVMFAPAVVFGSLGQMMTPLTFGSWQKVRGRQKRLQRRRSLCQEAFFHVALGRAPGVYTQCVCQVTIERYLAFRKLGFLERQSTVSSFSS